LFRSLLKVGCFSQSVGIPVRFVTCLALCCIKVKPEFNLNTSSEKELVYLGVKVPKVLADLLDQAVLSDTHTSRSEFVRDAIRQELARRGFEFNRIPQVQRVRLK
jgi:hypothetical protein